MQALPLFLIAVFFIGMILTIETAADPSQPRIRPFGLLGWLGSGNWPAKVGAGLLVIGIGALLRYALIHVDIPAQLKLGSGIVLSTVLGAASLAMQRHPGRRPIALALAGAAFGVAYLTAYAAYGYFGYINDVNALALLALVAVAAGVFAVSSNAMSVAVLAMVGAYIAPRFAIGSPGPLAVYGYYLAASTLTLFMVMLRGWRPLIHLSFLFTLAGALFFGWSGKFYEAQYYDLMQPLLLALTAVHLAMPLLERSEVPAGWTSRFDRGYFLLLPAVAAALTLKIAPVQELQGALGLAGLALLWGAAAALLAGFKREGAGRHAALACLLALAAFLCWGPDIPWALFGLAVAVTMLAIAPAMGWSRGMQEFACVLALCFGGLHIVNSIMLTPPATLFINVLFGQRLSASAMLLLAAAIARRRAIGMDKILAAGGITWAALAVLAELLRIDIDFWPQLAYGVVLGTIVLLALARRRLSLSPAWGALLMAALFVCGWWAGDTASAQCVHIYLALTPLALLVLAWAERAGDEFTAASALFMLPLALLPWLAVLAGQEQIDSHFFEAAMLTAAALVAAIAGRLGMPRNARWHGSFKAVHFGAVALGLLWVTLFYIERGGWPVAFEMLALVYLMVLSLAQHDTQAPFRFATGSVVVLAFVLVVQAMVLRVLGPAGIMNATDIFRIELPAVLSLMWAVFGAALAWRGTAGKSRTLWSLGAVLLALSAAKLVLFDFGSLGQLGNILALIGAGLLFMGVAWFAPMPPVPPAPPPPTRKAPPPPAASAGSSAPQPGAAPAARSQASQEATNSRAGLWFALLLAALLFAMISSMLGKHRHHVEQLREAGSVQRVGRPPVLLAPLPAPQVDQDDVAHQVEALERGEAATAQPADDEAFEGQARPRRPAGR